MDTYGLIGFPLTHSYSQSFFTKKFECEGIDARYLNYEIRSIDGLKEILANQSGLKGLNVTIPYKCEVLSMLDELSEEAREIGAVNVIRVFQKQEHVILKGYNTDVMGFTRSISPLLKAHHRNALVLGTGGASRAVCYSFKKLGLDTMLVSRNKSKGQFNYNDLNEDVLREFCVIVNCTPLGTFPNVNECPDIPYHLLGEDHLLFDLVYNPEETLFLKKGKAQGAIVKNGMEMLQFQALSAWNIWNNLHEDA